jgi:hypothetical protein
MATTIRVSTPPLPLWLIFALDPFGAEVARTLAASGIPLRLAETSGEIRPDNEDLSSSLVGCDGCVVAGIQPAPALLEVIEAGTMAAGVPWLGVVLDHPWLRVGPVIAPGLGCCHRCWRRRLRQHAGQPDIDSALEHHLALNPNPSTAGYLPPTAHLGALVAAGVMRRLPNELQAEAGVVRQVHVMTRHMVNGQTIGLHGCDRCGLHRPETERSFANLHAAAADALGWPS